MINNLLKSIENDNIFRYAKKLNRLLITFTILVLSIIVRILAKLDFEFMKIGRYFDLSRKRNVILFKRLNFTSYNKERLNGPVRG